MGKNEKEKTWSKHFLGILSGPIAFMIVCWLPFLKEMNQEAIYVLATFAWFVAWVIAAPFSWGISSLIPLVILPIVGMDFNSVAGMYGQGTMFLCIAVLLIGEAISKHGLGKRIAVTILSMKWIDGRFSRFLFVFMMMLFCLLPILMSGATFMMFSLTTSTIAYLTEECKKNRLDVNENRLRASMGCGLLYAFFAAFMTTIPAYTHNSVNVGLIKQINGIDINFFQWMIPGVAIGFVTLVCLYLVIRIMNPIGEDHIFGNGEYFKRQKAELGKMTLGEKMSLALFLILLILWVLPSVVRLPERITAWLNMYWVAVVGVVAAFILPADLEKKEGLLTSSDFKKLDWNMFLLVACGMGLTGLLKTTGFTEFVSSKLTGISGMGLVALAALGTTGITSFMSGLATDMILMNIILPVIGSTGIHPLVIGKICAGLGMTLIFPWGGFMPAMCFSLSGMQVKDVIKMGIVATITAIIVVTFGNLLLVPLVV